MADGAGKAGALSTEALNEIIDRIVKIAQPDKIILFGSAARGTMGRDSDVDLLVVKSGDYHRRRLAQDIRLHLWGIKQAVDVVVVKPDDIAQYGNENSLVIAPALREGRVVYGV